MGPSRTSTESLLPLLACALAVSVLSGCANLDVPRIDPSGQYVFVDQAGPPVYAMPVAQPAIVAPPLQPIAAGPVVQPAPNFPTPPGPPLPRGDIAVQLSPARVIAPVGTEVVLIAGVQGGDGYLRTNRRLEWSIGPGGVGQFVAVGEGGLMDMLLGDLTWPRVVSPTFALGITLRENVRLHHPATRPADDVCVARGQGWASVVSPVEGTSCVSVFAPDVIVPAGRSRSTLIHWIDAQFGFPPPAINPAGSRHVFTTTVLRQTNHCPHVGWLVRYTIVSGPPAGFTPGGATTIEVPTNQAGQAAAEIYQKQPVDGTNQISIQVIRPATAGLPCGESLVVSNGSTLKTWTSSALPVRETGPVAAPAGPQGTGQIEVNIAGPTQASVGGQVTFQITVTNRGSVMAGGLIIKDRFDAGLEHEVAKSPIERTLGDLAPGQSHQIAVTFRATKSGRLCHRAEILTAEGVKASADSCVVVAEAGPSGPLQVPPPASGAETKPTPAATPPILVRKIGPAERNAGQIAEFSIEISNPGSKTLSNLRVVDTPDRGLVPVKASEGYQREGGSLVWTIPSLGPGQNRQLQVHCECQAPAATVSNRVSVTSQEGSRGDAEAIVAVRETSKPAAPSGALTMTVAELQNPVAARQAVTYVIRVTNSGLVADRQVVLTLTLPERLAIEPWSTHGPPGKATKYKQEGPTIRFDPLPEIQPGQTLDYRVTVRTRQPGPLRIQAQTTSQNQLQPIVREKTTDVLPAEVKN